jgi:hypothetical protein
MKFNINDPISIVQVKGMVNISPFTFLEVSLSVIF